MEVMVEEYIMTKQTKPTMASTITHTIHGVVKCTERPHGTVGSGQNQKSLYRFHPDTSDGDAPQHMVVPYKINLSKFSKAKHDMFAVVEVVEAEICPVTPTTTIQPIQATLQQVFGAVGDYDVYMAYQLSRHGIAPSIARFTKNVRRALSGDGGDGGGAEDPTLEDRTDRHIITIDPAGCRDADDAMGAVEWTDEVTGDAERGAGTATGSIISTYITHVPRTMERLGMWSNFDPTIPFRVATTYLPDHNLPMLPRTLSEWECSLVERDVRQCLAMDLYVSAEGRVVRVEFVECLVRVSRNYVYESPEMRADPVYRLIHSNVGRLNGMANMRLVETVNDSHDVVEWLMLRMNCEAGDRLYTAGRGIFRSVVVDEGVGVGVGDVDSHPVTGKARKFMSQYRNTTASYELAEDDAGHGLVGGGRWAADHPSGSVGGPTHTHTTHYAQITSPIRRFVDLINMTVLCEIIRGSGVDENAHVHTHTHTQPFLTKPFLAHLNIQMRGIRRVQNDVALVAFGIAHEGAVVDGVVVDRSEMSMNSGCRRISVFIECIGGGKSFSVPVRDNMRIVVGDEVQLKVVSLPSKSTAYQKIQLSVV